MASIHRRSGTPYWHAAWRDAHGKQYLRSTRETDRGRALAMAHDFERAEKLAGAGTLTEVQAREILADIVKRSNNGEVFRNYSIAQWLKEWMEGKASRKTESTTTRYQQIVDEFITHLGDKAKRSLAALTSRDIQAFLTRRTKAGCSPTTVNLDGKILRTALNQARREGLISTNPAEAVELPSREPVERGTFTSTEVRMLVDAAEGEWPTLILLGYYAGARLSDCCNMVWTGERTKGNLTEGVDFTKGTLTYWQQKTNKLVSVLLHSALRAHLEKVASTAPSKGFISPHMAGLRPGGRHGLSEGFKRIVVKAGLDLQTVPGSGRRRISRRTFHALRHSFTSLLSGR
ncbi:MAG: tyrosine-type recombinase/integrase [Verrucomicrobiia bacterium]